jgi:CDP-4-dehydro-6-deoxyglucose reductase
MTSYSILPASFRRSCHSEPVTEFDGEALRYRVRSTEAVTPVIRELWLEPVDEALTFRAGQYVLLADAGYRIPQRSYSVANAPRGDGLLSLLVTIVPGGPTSTWAHRLAAGDEVSVEGPFGTFVTSPGDRSPVLLLGAGSGLAPLRALAEELTGLTIHDASAGLGQRCGSGARPVTLFFSCRTRADAIDRARFEALDRDLAAFDYRLTCTRDAREQRHARIPDLLAAEFETLVGTAVFAAGPPGFVAGCRHGAITLGADPADVRTEEFFPEPAPHAARA